MSGNVALGEEIAEIAGRINVAATTSCATAPGCVLVLKMTLAFSDPDGRASPALAPLLPAQGSRAGGCTGSVSAGEGGREQRLRAHLMRLAERLDPTGWSRWPVRCPDHPVHLQDRSRRPQRRHLKRLGGQLQVIGHVQPSVHRRNLLGTPVAIATLSLDVAPQGREQVVQKLLHHLAVPGKELLRDRITRDDGIDDHAAATHRHRFGSIRGQQRAEHRLDAAGVGAAAVEGPARPRDEAGRARLPRVVAI